MDVSMQTVLSVVIPTVTVLVGILINNSRLTDMNNRIGELRAHMDARFHSVDQGFDDLKDTWRSELYRVEQVLDARLKHFEER